MSKDDKGIVGTIIYWVLVFLFIKILFHIFKAIYRWIKNENN